MTTNTSATASTSVKITSRIATLMNVEESYGMNQVTPAGKLGCSSAILAFTALMTSSALALGSSWMPNAATGMPPTRVSNPYCDWPSSTCATSLSRTALPFGLVRSRMFSNCCGEVKRPSAITEAFNC